MWVYLASPSAVLAINPGSNAYYSSQLLTAIINLFLAFSFPNRALYITNSFSRLPSDLLNSSSGRNKLILQKILPSNFLTVDEFDYGYADFINSSDPRDANTSYIIRAATFGKLSYLLTEGSTFFGSDF